MLTIRQIIRASKSRPASRAGHDSTAYGCKWWTGDRADFRLSATCPICEPTK